MVKTKQHINLYGNDPSWATHLLCIMKQCAVVLNGNDVITVSNLKRKYNKIISNPNMKLLEECDEDELKGKYEYWKSLLNRDIKEEKDMESKFYHFRNKKTGCTIASIYPNLDNLKAYVKDWMDYERDNVENSK